jgi:outer membrane protein assembly factor BamB
MFLPRTLSFATLLVLAHIACGADWPHFRGPDRTGISLETQWRSEWKGDIPVAWKASVGLGYSGVVVSRGRLATAGYANGKDTVYCFDAVSGKSLWTHSYPAELGDRYYEGGTTGAPTFDGEHLFWVSRWGDLKCFEAATGRIVWEKNIAAETGAPVPTWGITGAPLVTGDLLVLNVGDAGAAVEKTTGKLVWKSAAKDCGYSTPLPWGSLAIFGSAKGYVAVKIKTGEEVWRVRWLTEYGVNAADPVLGDGRMFVSSGYGKGGALFRLSGEAAPEEIWKTKNLRTQLNAAVLFEGHLYGVDGDTTQKATLKCLDFQTGEEKWAEPGFGSGGVIVAGGRLLALSGIGELMIAPASPAGFKPTARTQVFGPNAWTAPVLANGFVYCRNGRGELVALPLQ